jgi:aryl-alcohol dehydrogenase-like predicted oxidoreductase
MKYIKIGDMQISKIGLGTTRFGTRLSEEESFALMDVYTAYGGNVLDTARNYYEWVENGRGTSEKTIGKWLKLRGNRDKIIIVTKGGVFCNNGAEWKIDLSRGKLLEEAKESLEALSVNDINIYLLHRDEPNRSVEEIVETMQVIKKTVKVSLIGVSNWDIDRVRAANAYAEKKNYEPFMVIQTWWSLAEYTDAMWNDPASKHMDKETYNYILDRKMLAMAFTSQSKGFFQKAILHGIDNINQKLRERIVTPVNLKKLEYIKNYCKKNKVSPTAVVIGYITSNCVMGTALVSCTKKEQLIDILDNSDYILPQKIIKEIDCIGLNARGDNIL